MTDALVRLTVLATAVVLGWQLQCLRLAFASLRWKPVRARVLSCHVGELPGFILGDADFDARADGNHSANVRYAYKVLGTAFVCTRLSYRPTRWILFSEAIDYLQGLRSGIEVDAFYDPARPSRAVLVPGPSEENILRVAIALLAFAVALWVWLR